MEYREYINLGFTRIDQNDEVEFNKTGYSGFILSKAITPTITIEVLGSDLNSPKMYIEKQGQESWHIILITGEMIKDIIIKDMLCSE